MILSDTMDDHGIPPPHFEINHSFLYPADKISGVQVLYFSSLDGSSENLRKNKMKQPIKEVNPQVVYVNAMNAYSN